MNDDESFLKTTERIGFSSIDKKADLLLILKTI